MTRLDALKVLGDPIATRYRESEERPRTIAYLRETLNDYLTKATVADDKYAHIEEKDKQSIVEKVATIQKWLDDQIVRQAERPKNEEPVLTTVDLAKKRDEIIYFATPILSKPKPKAVVTPPPTQNGTQTPRTDTPDPAAQAADGGTKESGASKGQPEMDID